jgi:hypothetical protein
MDKYYGSRAFKLLVKRLDKFCISYKISLVHSGGITFDTVAIDYVSRKRWKFLIYNYPGLEKNAQLSRVRYVSLSEALKDMTIRSIRERPYEMFSSKIDPTLIRRVRSLGITRG